jgi:hypothetical protein
MDRVLAAAAKVVGFAVALAIWNMYLAGASEQPARGLWIVAVS